MPGLFCLQNMCSVAELWFYPKSYDGLHICLFHSQPTCFGSETVLSIQILLSLSPWTSIDNWKMSSCGAAWLILWDQLHRSSNLIRPSVSIPWLQAWLHNGDLQECMVVTFFITLCNSLLQTVIEINSLFILNVLQDQHATYFNNTLPSVCSSIIGGFPK